MIPNGVDVKKFSPGSREMRGKIGVGDDEVMIIVARRMAPKNGVSVFARSVRALAGLPVRIVFAGDGEERPTIEKLIDESGLADRVTLLGNIPNDQMPSFLRAADMSVLPSLMEATSIAGLEAMACGLPLVGTNVGGIPEIIENEVTGLLVPKGDAAALGNAVKRLTLDALTRRAMGVAARERVEAEFSWPVIAGRTAEIYWSCRRQDERK